MRAHDSCGRSIQAYSINIQPTQQPHARILFSTSSGLQPHGRG
ncbi:uncharacterized protein G6M90_00g011260 [Metarhizium brunneum]|uniref:Uncharacterized protein n=1 Tax=Metarhizium brunneum TaxID=500148 RepID=A0A7D5YXQ3_9HYPO|nr:hypothetical protein G6M90_00g011260 [Metarhizium brunneum]